MASFLDVTGLTYLWGLIKPKIDSKQDILVSGTNIKTINSQSIVGSGNISVSAEITIDNALSSTSTNPVQNKVINTALSNKANSSHTHGKITNTGDITTTVTIASGDRLVINDESASQINNSSITFGTNTTTCLSNKGTWVTPSGVFRHPKSSSVLASYTSAFSYTATADCFVVGSIKKSGGEIAVTLNSVAISESTYGLSTAWSMICIPLKSGDVLAITNISGVIKVFSATTS